MTLDVHVVVAYPLLNQAQGDGGNALALRRRVELRGGRCQVTTLDDGPLPRADIVLIGGLDEDGVADLAERLRTGGLVGAVDDGVLVLAVNAGYVALGNSWVDETGLTRRGLGLLPVSFSRGRERTRPVVAESMLDGVPTISAYESHRSLASTTTARSFAHTSTPAGPEPEGCIHGTIMGTFLHGPLLARNTLLADALIERALGISLEAAPEGWAGEVRRQRIAEDQDDPTGWAGMAYGKSLGRRR